jgi:predicted RNase H-like HicB family nuclease
MQLTVFVERIDERTYRAEIAQPVSLATEGHTREEAIERLRALARQRLVSGEMLQLDLPEIAEPQPHPWVPYAGIWRNHPAIDTLLKDIASARRRRDKSKSET